MIRRTRTAASLALMLLLVGCTPTAVISLSETGDEAIVETPQGRLTGELVGVADSLLYVVVHESEGASTTRMPGRLVGIAPTSVRTIKIRGYSVKSWIPGVIILQVIPAILMGIAASQVEAEGALGVTAVLMVPAGVTALLFGAATPAHPGAEAPLTDDALQRLRKYARYPQGLQPAYLQALLQQLGQQDVLRLEDQVP